MQGNNGNVKASLGKKKPPRAKNTMMNFLSAFQFLSPTTYSFQLQYLFFVGRLPQSIKRAIPNETEYNQISKKIKPIKPKVIFLLSSLDRLHPFFPIHARLRALVGCKGVSASMYDLLRNAYRFVCTLQQQVAFLSVSYSCQSTSLGVTFLLNTNKPNKRATDEHFLGTFVSIYLLKFQQIFSWKENASGPERVRESQQFSFSLEKWSDSLQLHIQDLIKLPLSGQHARPLPGLWFDWCAFARKWEIKPRFTLESHSFRWNWEICFVSEKLNKVFIRFNWSNAGNRDQYWMISSLGSLGFAFRPKLLKVLKLFRPHLLKNFATFFFMLIFEVFLHP